MGNQGASMLKKDSKLPGLYLRDRASGAVWIVKAKQHGSRSVVTVTLGRAEVLTPAQARREAQRSSTWLHSVKVKIPTSY